MVMRSQFKLAKKWTIGILLVILVAGASGAEVKIRSQRGQGTRHQSAIWSLGSSSKKATSAPLRIRATTQAPARTTRSHIWDTKSPFGSTTRAPVRTTHSPIWDTKSHFRSTTQAPIRKATTQGPVYPHPKPAVTTTTRRPYYPTQVHTPAPPIYPGLPNPPPIYVPPPPPQQNPNIIIIREPAPKSPKITLPIIIGGFGSRKDNHKFSTPSTTTTRRPKTTTEEPWQGIEGGYNRKEWINFVKSTQRKDVPLSGQWVRIRGGKSMREGYVEIRGEGGLWGSVCDAPARWDLHKANIVCRQLGFRGGAEAAWQGRPANTTTIIEPSQVREVNCGLVASTLLHCDLRKSKDGFPSEIDMDGTCFGRTRNVGVRCRPEPNTVCRFGEKPFGSSCYRLVSAPSYGLPKDMATLGAEAVKTCRSIPRSEIVSVTTQAENDFLSDWLQSEYPSVNIVLTSGIGTHSRMGGPNKPVVEWWLWSGQYRDVEYERWWPGWTSKSPITPIVPPKSMMCIVLQNMFPQKDNGPLKTADYFFWKAHLGTEKSVPISFVCERPADDVGCLTPNEEYTGPANITESGKACLKWNLQEVRNSPIMSHLLLTAPSRVNEIVNTGGNACRRVTIDKEPWCFVSPGPGQQPIPEQCLVPMCNQPPAITSYYEAPIKTNLYAPSFNQMPELSGQAPRLPLDIISKNLPGFSYDSIPLTTMTDSRSVVTKEQTDFVTSYTGSGVVETKIHDINLSVLTVPFKTRTLEVDFEPNATLAAIEHPRNLVEVITEGAPTTTFSSQSGNENLPGAPYDNSLIQLNHAVQPYKMGSQIIHAKSPFNETEPQTDRQDTLEATPTVPSSLETSNTQTPSVTTDCKLLPEYVNTTEQNGTTTSANANYWCSPTVTYPLVPTQPSLSYPHPENEIIMTTVRTTDVPKRSLYSSWNTTRTRYAAGKGHSFQRQLSSSDLVLILNGILPLEEMDERQQHSSGSNEDTPEETPLGIFTTFEPTGTTLQPLENSPGGTQLDVSTTFEPSGTTLQPLENSPGGTQLDVSTTFAPTETTP